MNPTELAAHIQKLSVELNELIVSSFSTKEVTALDNDLMKQKCIALYDSLLKVNPSIAPIAAVKEVIPEVIVEAIPIVKQEEPVTLFSAPIPVINDIPEPTIEIPVVEIVEEQKTETEIQNEIIDEIIELQQEIEEKEATPQLKEIISELSLHEKIASALPTKPDLADRLSSNVSNLKSAINVNLKIALVNDLFRENSVEYVKAIDKLNSAENNQEAMLYFAELKHTYSWDSENSLVRELETLVQKRFA